MSRIVRHSLLFRFMTHFINAHLNGSRQSCKPEEFSVHSIFKGLRFQVWTSCFVSLECLLYRQYSSSYDFRWIYHLIDLTIYSSTQGYKRWHQNLCKNRNSTSWEKRALWELRLVIFGFYSRDRRTEARAGRWALTDPRAGGGGGGGLKGLDPTQLSLTVFFCTFNLLIWNRDIYYWRSYVVEISGINVYYIKVSWGESAWL